MYKKNSVKTPKESVLRKDIYQANPLINARKGMNIVELRIFALGLQGINPHRSSKDKFYDEEFPMTFIPTPRIVQIFGNTKYLHVLKKICDRLFDSHITLNYSDGGFELLHIFQYLKYKPKEGLYIQFDDKMKPYILDLFQSKGYTKINIEQVFPLMSAYAVRLVEMLLQFQGTKQKKLVRKVNVDDLRFSLNVPDDAYSGRMNNFKKFVIEEPITEINEKTEYKMSYSVIKTGRKITGFEFYMDITKALERERKREEEERGKDGIKGYIIEALRRHGIREKEGRELLKNCKNTEDCIHRLMYAEEELERQRNTITNEGGFIVKGIKENWYRREFERRREEVANRESEGVEVVKEGWKKLMGIFDTYNVKEIKERAGIERMLNEKEVKEVRRDLLGGGFTVETKKKLEELGWDYGLAVDVFSFNNKK